MHLAGWSQCTNCTYTAPAGGTNFNLNGNEVLCIDGNASNLNINYNGSGNTICVNQGSTLVLSNGSLAGVDIDVYGTLEIAGNLNFNTQVNINIKPTGVLDLNTNGLNSNNLTINNEGCFNFNNTGQVSMTNVDIVNNDGAKIDASSTSKVLYVGGTFCNGGTAEFNEFENNEMEKFHNETTGELIFNDLLFNHGAFLNDGEAILKNGLRVGNKGPGKEFLVNSCMCIIGDVDLEGPAFLNATLRISDGDLNIEALVSGMDGSILVDNGISTIGAAGAVAGTNFSVCDQDTTGNDFDNISANSMSINMYNVDCSIAATACSCCNTTTCVDITVSRN